MKKILLLIMICMSCNAWAGDDVVGYWTTIDDETNTAKSVVQIYEYQGKIYGRVVELFKNKDAVAKLPDEPLIKGLDVIWDMKKKSPISFAITVKDGNITSIGLDSGHYFPSLIYLNKLVYYLERSGVKVSKDTPA